MDREHDLVAGRNPVMELIKSGATVSRILVSNRHKEGSVVAILALAKNRSILVKEVAPEKLDSLYPQGGHQGVIAMISPIEFTTVEEILDEAAGKHETPFLVILDGIMDVHNLGAIARTAEAAGAHGILMGKHRAAPVTPMAVKASAGALFHIPVAMVTNLTAVMEDLKKRGIWIYGTHQDGKTDYDQADYAGPMAVVIGSEDKGMGRLVRETCDFTIRIPMKGRMSSLNASNAAAIILFEAVRKRKNHGVSSD